jgi:hypothetical protein
MTRWCIQEFITGAILTALVLLVALDVPIGVFLDVITPGLLVARPWAGWDASTLAAVEGLLLRLIGVCGHPINAWEHDEFPPSCWNMRLL